MDLIFESSAVAACLFAATKLNLYIGVSHSHIAISQFQYNICTVLLFAFKSYKPY